MYKSDSTALQGCPAVHFDLINKTLIKKDTQRQIYTIQILLEKNKQI